jgi:large subunit ribosomal protein L4
VEINIYTLENKSDTGLKIELPGEVFSLTLDHNFISMHFQRMKAANYIPTNKTKNVSEVSGTTRKPYKQKHTGNARQGSLRSAQFVGGGVAFGPRAVKAFIKLPKAEVCLAKSMLIAEAYRQSSLFVVDNINFSSHKTSLASKVLNTYSKAKNIVIIHHKNVAPNSLLAVRNIPGIKYVDVSMLTTFDLIQADKIIVDQSSFGDLIKSLII